METKTSELLEKKANYIDENQQFAEMDGFLEGYMKLQEKIQQKENKKQFINKTKKTKKHEN